MRLLSLTLNGTYKGLKDQYFDFQQTTGNIVALIGLNGSGKSQLLELIAESFAYLERWQRTDFKNRTAMGFGVCITYSCNLHHDVMSHLYHDDLFTVNDNGQVELRVEIDIHGMVNVAINKNKTWSKLVNERIIPLPFIVGYSSGLNENLQRSFMKNAVQYFDIIQTRLKRLKALSADLNDDQISDINKYFLKRHPHVFSSEYPFNTESYLLELKESDTPASKSIYVDYDSAGLFLLALSILPNNEIESLLGEVTYKHPTSVELRYDLRKGVAGLDTIRDVQMLARVAGKENINGVGNRTTDKQFDLYELDYLAGDILLDLTNTEVIGKLREANYNDPLILFNRLYKAQQLGVGNWQGSTRTKLRRDDFIGTVKKPLKTKLPLSISKLMLADNGQNKVSFDDLSDGEAQLLQILATSVLFSTQRTLILLDEPETHLNPSWRTHFHRQLSKVIGSQEVNMQQPQVFLSTHSPFMVSSLMRENVLFFERDNDGLINMVPVGSQTYGASFEVLIKKHFGLKSLISQTVVEAVKEHLPKDEQPESLTTAKEWIEKNLGDSMEKAYLIRKLQR